MNNINYDKQLFIKACEKLQNINFENIIINDVQIKILGIYFNQFVPSINIKRHKHSFFEFSYALQGKMNICTHGKEYEVLPNSFYILPPSVYHSHSVDSASNYYALSIRWALNKQQIDCKDNLYRLLNKLSSVSSKPIKDTGCLLNSFNHLMNLTEEQNVLKTKLKLAFTEIIMTILNYYLEDLGCRDNDGDNNIENNNVIEMAIDFIEDNYNGNINVVDVADSIYLSYSHLSRLFKKYTGSTVNEYIKETRLKNANLLILTTDKSIGEIADIVGFKSENYFCKVFKKRFKVLPKEMRKNKKDLDE